jgi:hypothetical protein
MPERHAEVSAALDRLVEAMRAHLAAVATAEVADDDTVWQAYIALNNAAHDYDEILNEVYDEVTPFDLETMTDEEADSLRAASLSPPSPGRDDPYPRVVSVRQRRDYRVPSVTALLRVAELGRPAPADGGAYEPVRTVGAAVIELLQSGDGSLAMLDLPELEPLDGVIVVAEVDTALPPDVLDGLPDPRSDAPFHLGAGDAVLARLHESALPEADTDSRPDLGEG